MPEDTDINTYEQLFENKQYKEALTKIQEEIDDSKDPCPSLEHNKLICEYMLSDNKNIDQLLKNLDTFMQTFSDFSAKEDIHAYVAKVVVSFNKALTYFNNYQYMDCINLLQTIINDNLNKPELYSILIKCYLFWIDCIFQIYISHSKSKEWLDKTYLPVMTSLDHYITKTTNCPLDQDHQILLQLIIHLYKAIYSCYIDYTKGTKKEIKSSSDLIKQLPESMNNNAFMACVSFIRSKLEFNRHNYSKALKTLDIYYNDTQNVDVNSKYIYNNCVGNIQYMLGNTSLAIYYYKQAIQNCSNSLHKLYIQRNLALAYSIHKDYEYSIQLFQQCLNETPYNPFMWMRMGENYLQISLLKKSEFQQIPSFVSNSHYLIGLSNNNNIGQGAIRQSLVKENSTQTNQLSIQQYSQSMNLSIQCLRNAISLFKNGSVSIISSNPYHSDNFDDYTPLLHSQLLLAFTQLELHNPSEALSTIQDIFNSGSLLSNTLLVLLNIYYVQASILLGKIDDAFDKINPLKAKDLYMGTYLGKQTSQTSNNKDKDKKTIPISVTSSDTNSLPSIHQKCDTEKVKTTLLYYLAVLYYLKENNDSSLDVLNHILTINPKCKEAIKLYYIVYMKTKGEVIANEYILNTMNPFS